MVTKRGRFIRPAWERQYLELNRKTILCVELRGEIFFGSARNVFDQVCEGDKTMQNKFYHYPVLEMPVFCRATGTW